MDLSSQQGNRELVKKAKIVFSGLSHLGKFAHFRVGRVKISCREAYQERFFRQNGVQGCSGRSSRKGGTARGVHGRMLR